MKTGKLYFITGLHATGKTSIGKELYKLLKNDNTSIVFLDGDILRNVFADNLGHSKEERHLLAERYVRIAKLLTDQQIDVILCTISMFRDVRSWCRENIDDYIEIYIRSSLPILLERDPQNIYARAISGLQQNVMGVNMKYEEPETPDIIIDNNNQLSVEKLAEYIYQESKKEDRA